MRFAVLLLLLPLLLGAKPQKPKAAPKPPPVVVNPDGEEYWVDVDQGEEFAELRFPFKATNNTKQVIGALLIEVVLLDEKGHQIGMQSNFIQGIPAGSSAAGYVEFQSADVPENYTKWNYQWRVLY
jgi:hypothetical protein